MFGKERGEDDKYVGRRDLARFLLDPSQLNTVDGCNPPIGNEVLADCICTVLVFGVAF
jgi:hypothetical protein